MIKSVAIDVETFEGEIERSMLNFAANFLEVLMKIFLQPCFSALKKSNRKLQIEKNR